VDWEGPGVFAIILLTILALFRKWKILLITLLTVVLGWGAQDIIVMNLETNMRIISLSLLIYCIGGGLMIILSLISFFRMVL
jgi:hypothetical protein